MSRNPFNVSDVPDPNDDDVAAFVASASLDASAEDENASAWALADDAGTASVEGHWSSRWNGGADPTIPGDSDDKWKQGRPT